MDDLSREELQELKDRLFYEMLQEIENQITPTLASLRQLRADIGNVTLPQDTADFCDDGEKSCEQVYHLLDEQIAEIKKIIIRLNDDDADN